MDRQFVFFQRFPCTSCIKKLLAKCVVKSAMILCTRSSSLTRNPKVETVICLFSHDWNCSFCNFSPSFCCWPCRLEMELPCQHMHQECNYLSLEPPNHGWKLWIKKCLFLAPLTISRQGSDLNSVLPKNLPECTATLITYFHLLITLLIAILIIKFCLLQSDQHLMTPLMTRKIVTSYSPFLPIGNRQPTYLVTPLQTSPIRFEDVIYDVRKHVLIWIVGEIVVCKNKMDMRWTQERHHKARKSIILLPYKETHNFVELAVPFIDLKRSILMYVAQH